MAAGDTYLLKLIGSANGQAVVNDLYVRAMNAGDMSQAFADSWNTSCLTTWRACHTSDYTLNTISVRQINPPGPVAYERAPTAGAGTLGAASADMTAAACVKFTTSYIGRTRRGRNFVGPIPGASILQGALLAAYVTAVNAYYAALWGLWGTSGSDRANGGWVVWSHKIARTFSQATPPAMGDPTSASAYVVAYHLDPNARSLRRRELGVGS